MTLLHELLKPSRLVSIVDVGAAAIDGPPPYQAMLDQRLCRVVGFEPQIELWGKQTPEHTWCPETIGIGQPVTLRVCAAPGMTSVYVPDDKTLSCFPGFEMWGKVLRELPVTTRALDDIDFGALDFLKVDAQGSELAVIQGARKKLESALFVQAEVAFVPLYVKQPMFRDVDSVLEELGFVFHTFADINRRMILPSQGATPYEAMNQVQGADAVYVRDFRSLDRLDDEQLKHIALIAYYCYASLDLAWRCVDALVGRGCLSQRDASDCFKPKTAKPEAGWWTEK